MSPPGDCREHIEVTDEVNIDESHSTVKAELQNSWILCSDCTPIS